MSITSLIATIALFLFAIFMSYVAVRDNNVHIKNLWLFPAILSVLFIAFSAYAGASEGPFGFWTEHTRNIWGNQIWFDLLLSASVGWSFVVPKCKEVGMRPLPWVFLVVATGSMGFLAMIARLLYLQEKAKTVEN